LTVVNVPYTAKPSIIREYIKGKVKLSLKQAVEAHRVMRRRGSHIFQTVGSQMVVRPYVLAILYPQEDSWYSYLLEAELTPGP
jgi:hypothetical protein